MNIKTLVHRKHELIALKKAEIKTVKGGISAVVNTSTNISKSAANVIEEDTADTMVKTIIGNTYLWMDNHDDVHAKSVFTKSLKERKNQIFHLHDHEFKLVAKVGEPQNVYEKEVPWSQLGINKKGNTTALFMDTEISKSYNENIFNAYKNNQIQQHSVGMQYVKIDLAVNDEQYPQEHKVWQDHIGNLGNTERATEKGYFWLVREAKLIEISAVLLGSNELTPTLDTNTTEAVNNTSTESDKHTQLFNLLTKIKV